MRSRMRSTKFERLIKDGKAGLVAKHGSAAYKLAKIREKAQLTWG